jgi:hypothetical protein
MLRAAGFCAVELYAFGPLQFQVVAPVAAPARVSVEPLQTGLGVADAVTAVGDELTVTLAVVAVVVPQLFTALNV